MRVSSTRFPQQDHLQLWNSPQLPETPCLPSHKFSTAKISAAQARPAAVKLYSKPPTYTELFKSFASLSAVAGLGLGLWITAQIAGPRRFNLPIALAGMFIGSTACAINSPLALSSFLYMTDPAYRPKARQFAANFFSDRTLKRALAYFNLSGKKPDADTADHSRTARSDR